MTDLAIPTDPANLADVDDGQLADLIAATADAADGVRASGEPARRRAFADWVLALRAERNRRRPLLAAVAERAPKHRTVLVTRTTPLTVGSRLLLRRAGELLIEMRRRVDEVVGYPISAGC